MKFFLIAFAVIAAVAADVSHLPLNEYLPPVSESAILAIVPTNEYLTPVSNFEASNELADDGYHYKTQRRVVYRRNRRDVSHLPSNEYLPPAEQEIVKEVASNDEYLPPVAEHIASVDVLTVAEPAEQEIVKEVASNNEYLPPVAQDIPVVVAPIVAEPAHELADDGYHYKTQRRVVYRRHRRDVSHLPSNEYLPPAEQKIVKEVASNNEYLPPVAEHIAAVDVLTVAEPAEQEIVKQVVSNNEYLPPVAQDIPIVVAPIVAEPAHELADDGYHYKTQRRVVYRRHRRDVSHLPSNEYLPPAEQKIVKEVASNNEYLPPVAEAIAAIDVLTVAEPAEQEIVKQVASNNEYLPPVAQDIPIVVAPIVAEPAHELADDGYHYKTQRRVIYRRNRRDVSHLPSNEYLSPAEVAPIEEVSNTVLEEAAPAHELADDGYHYKTQRRVVIRRNRRDVSHLDAYKSLPPAQADAASSIVVEPIPAHKLFDDGYYYKTQRRVVYAQPDISDLQRIADEPAATATAAESAAPAPELIADGNLAKNLRRFVLRRNRRDVSHLVANEYLPPVEKEYLLPVEQEYLPPIQEIASEPSHELSSDGYHYKTQRRVVFRRH